MTAISTTTQSEELTFVQRQFSKVAWRRAWGCALAIGLFGAVGNSDNLKNAALAFGYAVGYGGAVLVMGAGAAMEFGKREHT